MAKGILLYEIYFIKTLFLSQNYGYNYKAGLWLFNIDDAIIPSPTTSRGTREKCHTGWAFCKLVKAWPFICEHWTWCWNQLTYQPFNPYSHIIILPLIKTFRSGKCEECMICDKSFMNITSSRFIFFAINIGPINCVKFINRTLHILEWMLIHIDGFTA